MLRSHDCVLWQTNDVTTLRLNMYNIYFVSAMAPNIPQRFVLYVVCMHSVHEH